MSRARAFVASAVTTASLTVPLLVAAAPARAADGGLGLAQGTDLIAVQPTGTQAGHLVAADRDAGTAGVVVTDAAGTNAVPVAIPNPTALALGPDGRTVWVSSSTGAVFSFDVDHPGDVLTHIADAMTCVSDLAVAGGNLVYLVEGGCADTPEYSLHTLDPSDGDALSEAISIGQVPVSSTLPLQIDNDPAHPSKLVVAGMGNPGWVDELDAAGSLTRIGSVSGVGVNAVSMAPDAKSVLVGTGSTLRRYSVAASPVPVGDPMYSDGWSFDGIDTDPSGAYVAGATYGTFLSYGPSRSEQVRSYHPSPAVSRGRTVAWLGRTLFALSSDLGAGTAYLRGHSDAITAPTSVSLVPPHVTPAVGKALKISGIVSDRGRPIADALVTLTRTDREGSAHYTTHTGPSGGYSFDNTPRDGLDNTYRVSYAGDALHAPTSSAVVLQVVRKATYLSIATDKTDYYYDQLATITAHLGTTYQTQSRNVTVYAQPYGQGKHKIGYGHVDSAGHFHATFRPQRNTVYSVTFAGDLRFAPVTRTLLRKTHARVSGELQNYYGTDSAGYRLYHKSHDAKFHAHIDPNKGGQCVHFDLQQFVNGKWKDLGWTDCYYLNNYSNTDVYWWLKNFAVLGGHYRTGLYWGGDSANEGTGSLWRYFKVTS